VSEDYTSHTRDRYRDAEVAATYARRQFSLRAPVEAAITALELRLFRKAVGALTTQAGAVVLDVPAGSGKLTDTVAKMGFRWVGGDISVEMLRHIQRPAAIVQCDITALPFRAESVNVAVILRLFHRVPESVMLAGLSEAARVCGDGLVISYARTPAIRVFYRLLQRLGRRPQVWTTSVSAQQLKRWTGSMPLRPLMDQSISAGLTSERIAALAKI